MKSTYDYLVDILERSKRWIALNPNSRYIHQMKLYTNTLEKEINHYG